MKNIVSLSVADNSLSGFTIIETSGSINSQHRQPAPEERIKSEGKSSKQLQIKGNEQRNPDNLHPSFTERQTPNGKKTKPTGVIKDTAAIM